MDVFTMVFAMAFTCLICACNGRRFQQPSIKVRNRIHGDRVQRLEDVPATDTFSKLLLGLDTTSAWQLALSSLSHSATQTGRFLHAPVMKADVSRPLRLQKFKEGQQISGSVVHVGKFGVFVDIGAERRGLLYCKDMKERIEDAREKFSESDVINGWVKMVDSGKKYIYLTTKKPVGLVAWLRSEEQSSGETLKAGNEFNGRVLSVQMQGAFVDIGADRRGLLHVSEMQDHTKDARKKLTQGGIIKGWIKSTDPEKRYITLSTRQENNATTERDSLRPMLEELRKMKENSLSHLTPLNSSHPRVEELKKLVPLEQLEIGQRFIGRVSAVRKFGVFVDIGAQLSGLLKIWEMEQDISDARENLTKGDEITGRIAAVDVSNRRISLTTRRLLEELRLGQVVTGRVSSVQKFGAFIDIGAERPVLLHVSEMGQSVRDAQEHFTRGDVVTGWLKMIDLEKKQVLLRYREWKPEHGRPFEELEEGQEFIGNVTAVQKSHVRIDFGAEKEGYLWMPDTKYWVHEASEEFQVGAEVKGWVKEINLMKNRIRLTTRKRERLLLEQLKVGQECSGQVTAVQGNEVWLDIGAEKHGCLRYLLGDARGQFRRKAVVRGWIKEIDLKEGLIYLTSRNSPRPLVEDSQEKQTAEVVISNNPIDSAKVLTPLEELEVGQKFSGRVVHVEEFGVFVDIGAQRQGMLYCSDIEDHLKDARTKFNKGDMVAGWIQQRLEYRHHHVWDAKETYYYLTTRIWRSRWGHEFVGRVSRVTKAHLMVDMGMQEGVLPVTEIDERVVDARDKFTAGDEITGWIKAIDLEKNDLYLTTHEPRRSSVEELKVGQDFSGQVVGVDDRCVFVDFGAQRLGLLHSKEAKKKFTEGSPISGSIWMVNLESGNVYLRTHDARKQSRPPLEELRAGQEFSGRVASVEHFGALVDIGAKSQGLLHVAETSSYIADARDQFSEGDLITGWIKSIDLRKGHLYLTTRLPVEDFNIGQVLEGRVVRAEKFRVFVDIGAQRSAMLHVAEMEEWIRDARARFTRGDMIESRVKSIILEKHLVVLTTRALDAEGIARYSAVW